MVVGGGKQCTRSCGSNLDCMSGTRCETIGGAKYCAGNDVGRNCNAAATCNFGCLTGPGYCTASCGNGSDCPNGYGCMLVSGQQICVKAEAPCSTSPPADVSKCIAPAACDESPNLIVGGCTLACNTAADCPRRAAGLAPWSCDGLCRRPADVVGPLPGGSTPSEWACDANNVVLNMCNDAEHIDFQQFIIPNPPAVNCVNQTMTTPGLPGDSCVDSCRYQGGCIFGFACTAVGNVGGSRVGLCLPTGGGGIGAVCSSDTQCLYGYCSTGKCSRDCTADGVCPGGASCVAVGGPAPTVEGAPFKRCQ
jgi:hypothetical protein